MHSNDVYNGTMQYNICAKPKPDITNHSFTSFPACRKNVERTAKQFPCRTPNCYRGVTDVM